MALIMLVACIASEPMP